MAFHLIFVQGRHNAPSCPAAAGWRQDVLHSPFGGLHRARPLLGHVGPVSTNEADDALSAEHPETEARIDPEAPAVSCPAIVVGQDMPVATPYHGVLNVSPRQLRTGMQN